MAEDKKKKKDAGGKKGGKGGGGGGPAFALEPGRGLRLFLLWALLPLAAITWCAVGWHGGPVLRGGRADLAQPGTWLTIGAVLGGVAVFVCSFWLFWPIAQWLRQASVQHFGSNKLFGFIPLVLAVPVWIAFYAAAALALVTGALVAWQGLERLGLPALVKALMR